MIHLRQCVWAKGLFCIRQGNIFTHSSGKGYGSTFSSHALVPEIVSVNTCKAVGHWEINYMTAVSGHCSPLAYSSEGYDTPRFFKALLCPVWF